MREFDLRWKKKAICAINGPRDDIFFSVRGRPQKRPLYKDYCEVCPVIEECRAIGILEGHSFGVWGGFTASELKNLPFGIRQTLSDWAQKALNPLEKNPQVFRFQKDQIHLEYLEDFDIPEFFLLG
ncbi:MAG: WhiB family transcriptional regulator [Betaproteobacteria bacterium]|nr:WhiB family transcriptional regulator [Betaproteobacteria bacterium]